MGKKGKAAEHVSETPATAWLKSHGVDYTEHPYEYLEHGGAKHSAAVLGLDPYTVVKTLVMQDQDAKPLLVLMHGSHSVSTKNLARQIGAKASFKTEAGTAFTLMIPASALETRARTQRPS